MKIKKIFLFIIILVAFPLAVYASENSTTNTQAQSTDKKPLYWVDTMEPDIHYDAPGKSRMGMELVPVYPKEKQSNSESSAKE